MMRLPHGPYRSLALVKTPYGYWPLTFLILLLLVGIVLGLVCIPWQQTVIGTGQVTVFSPMQRPQPIEAQLSGRLVSWNVIEGQHVEAGQLLGQLQDIDKYYLAPQQLAQLERQRAALEAKLVAAQQEAQASRAMAAAASQSQAAVLPSVQLKQAQTGNKIIQSEQKLQAAEQTLKTAQLNYQRREELVEQGLRSRRDFELAQLDLVKAQTDVEAARRELTIARQDQSIATLDIQKAGADTQGKISESWAKVASAEEGVASTLESLQKVATDIDGLKMRITQRQIRAPYAGTIVRLGAFGAGQTVKEGDQLAVLVPDTRDQAVELYLADYDVPLVRIGSPVRLQFSGWPALQFSGWPSVAVGTFAGRVAVIDAVEDGSKRFRLLVKPDLDTIARAHEANWPSSAYLRPGTEATGWVMLKTVPLWFELWRQFNAFPPTLDKKQMDEALKGRQAVPKLDSPYEKIKRPKQK